MQGENIIISGHKDEGYLKDIEIIGNGEEIGEPNGDGSYKIEIIKKGKNLFDTRQPTKDGFLLDQRGQAMAEASSFIGDFIKLDSNKTYCLSTTAINVPLRVGIYNQGKVWVRREYKGNSAPITFTGAHYARISSYIDAKNLLQLEEGSIPTQFEPFSPTGKGVLETFIIPQRLKNRETIKWNKSRKEYVISTPTGEVSTENKKEKFIKLEKGVNNIITSSYVKPTLKAKYPIRVNGMYKTLQEENEMLRNKIDVLEETMQYITDTLKLNDKINTLD